MLDNTMLVKVLAGGVGMVCVMVLALAGKIDGPHALFAVTTITSVFLGSAALLGGSQAIAGAMAARVAPKGQRVPPLPPPLPEVSPESKTGS